MALPHRIDVHHHHPTPAKERAVKRIGQCGTTPWGREQFIENTDKNEVERALPSLSDRAASWRGVGVKAGDTACTWNEFMTWESRNPGTIECGNAERLLAGWDN